MKGILLFKQGPVLLASKLLELRLIASKLALVVALPSVRIGLMLVKRLVGKSRSRLVGLLRLGRRARRGYHCDAHAPGNFALHTYHVRGV